MHAKKMIVAVVVHIHKRLTQTKLQVGTIDYNITFKNLAEV